MMSILTQSNHVTLHDFAKICQDARSSDKDQVANHWVTLSSRQTVDSLFYIFLIISVTSRLESANCWWSCRCRIKNFYISTRAVNDSISNFWLSSLKIMFQISTMGTKLGVEGVVYKENIFSSFMRMYNTEGIRGNHKITLSDF